MKKILIILLFTTFILTFVFYKYNIASNLDFEVNLEENILLNTSIDKNIINDNFESKYYYSFKDNSINLYSNLSNVNIEEYNSNIDMEGLFIEKGKLYINGKYVFNCNFEFCKHYIDKSGRYIIFVDKYLYREGFFNKVLPLSTLRVYDLKELNYKDYPLLKYNGENLNLVSIEGFFDN